MMHAATEVQEPYPTTEALLEKLQEVLEKADVEVCFEHCTVQTQCRIGMFQHCKDHTPVIVSISSEVGVFLTIGRLRSSTL